MIFPILVHFLINITYKFSQACPGGLPERAPCVWHREEGMLVVRSVPRPWVFLDWQQWPSVSLQVINCYRTGLCFSILLSLVSSCLIFLFIIYSFLFFFLFWKCVCSYGMEFVMHSPRPGATFLLVCRAFHWVF